VKRGRLSTLISLSTGPLLSRFDLALLTSWRTVSAVQASFSIGVSACEASWNPENRPFNHVHSGESSPLPAGNREARNLLLRCPGSAGLVGASTAEDWFISEV